MFIDHTHFFLCNYYFMDKLIEMILFSSCDYELSGNTTLQKLVICVRTCNSLSVVIINDDFTCHNLLSSCGCGYELSGNTTLQQVITCVKTCNSLKVVIINDNFTCHKYEASGPFIYDGSEGVILDT